MGTWENVETVDGLFEDDGKLSESHAMEDEDDGHWFNMGMTKEEKIEVRWPWKLSVIIKLVERTIGYQFLLKKNQIMWKILQKLSLIDLGYNFFIVKFTSKQDYETTLLNSPWMIAKYYLHVQLLIPNFVADHAEIATLPVWVRFLVLPVEYYSTHWLERAGYRIG